MKILILILFSFCLTSLNCLAQDNISRDTSNISDKQTISNGKQAIANDKQTISNDKQAIANDKQTIANDKKDLARDTSTTIKNNSPNDNSSNLQDSKINSSSKSKILDPEMGPHQNNTDLATYEPYIQEIWRGSIYTSTYKANVCIATDGELKGVLKLRTLFGDVDTYHFFGNLKNNKIYAKHGSGHVFKGKFISNKKVGGKITLKDGHAINIKGERIKSAELADFCAKL